MPDNPDPEIIIKVRQAVGDHYVSSVKRIDYQSFDESFYRAGLVLSAVNVALNEVQWEVIHALPKPLSDGPDNG
jgi:hypothetical protein